MKTKETNNNIILFAVNNQTELKNILQYVCDYFGGYSLTNMHGGWLNDNKEVIQEVSYKLEIIYKATDKESNLLKNLCKFIKVVANQKEVYFYTEQIKLFVC